MEDLKRQQEVVLPNHTGWLSKHYLEREEEKGFDSPELLDEATYFMKRISRMVTDDKLVDETYVMWYDSQEHYTRIRLVFVVAGNELLFHTLHSEDHLRPQEYSAVIYLSDKKYLQGR